jgi:truncated hemoglobin YjbI
MDPNVILQVSTVFHGRLTRHETLAPLFAHVGPDRYNSMMFHVFSIILDNGMHEMDEVVVAHMRQTHDHMLIAPADMEAWLICLEESMRECAVQEPTVQHFVRKLNCIYNSVVVDKLVDDISDDVALAHSCMRKGLTPGVIEKVHKLHKLLSIESKMDEMASRYWA